MAFRTLLTRLEMDQQTAEEVMRCGIDTLDKVGRVDDRQLRTSLLNVMKYPHPARPANAVVWLSPTTIDNVVALRAWVRQNTMTGTISTPDMFMQDTLEATMERTRELQSIKKSLEDQDIPKPPKLGKLSDWKKFWESVKTYFGSVRGAADIPLAYIYREVDVVDAAAHAAVYPNNDARYMRTTLLAGHWYTADNTRVWNEWKSLIQDGPGWDFIKRFDATNDGRGAILALTAQTESENSQNTRKNQAYTALQQLQYSGPRRDWDLQAYVNGHLAAHNELDLLGEPVPASKKVTDFLNGISDDRLDGAKDHILGDPTKSGSFDAAQKYLVLVNSNKSLAAAKKRGISALTQGEMGDPGAYLTGDRWKHLTKEDKVQLEALRAKADGRGNPQAGGHHMSKSQKHRQRRKVKKLAARMVAQAKVKDAAAGDEGEIPKDAGNQFGRDAHNKKGRKNKEK